MIRRVGGRIGTGTDAASCSAGARRCCCWRRCSRHARSAIGAWPALSCGPTNIRATTVCWLCHDCGMARTRLSTTVDAGLLQGARQLRSGTTDAVMIDEALAALIARHRAVEVDESYAAYDSHPLDEPDEWGDLASFREAAARS